MLTFWMWQTRTWPILILTTLRMSITLNKLLFMIMLNTTTKTPIMKTITDTALRRQLKTMTIQQATTESSEKGRLALTRRRVTGPTTQTPIMTNQKTRMVLTIDLGRRFIITITIITPMRAATTIAETTTTYNRTLNFVHSGIGSL